MIKLIQCDMCKGAGHHPGGALCYVCEGRGYLVVEFNKKGERIRRLR